MATDIEVNKKFKEVEQLAVHLRNQKSKSNSNANLHKHITEIMNHIVIHCPNDALNKLEEISYLIKNGDEFAIEDFLKVSETRMYSHPSSKELADCTTPIIDKSQTFFKVSTF